MCIICQMSGRWERGVSGAPLRCVRRGLRDASSASFQLQQLTWHPRLNVWNCLSLLQLNSSSSRFATKLTYTCSFWFWTRWRNFYVLDGSFYSECDKFCNVHLRSITNVLMKWRDVGLIGTNYFRIYRAIARVVRAASWTERGNWASTTIS